ncbi:hypothetical protein ACX1C1_08530 [Paenibacillus sp. strain BS8-2]
MEAFFTISAVLLMPLYAFGFIMFAAGLLYNLKKDEQISGYAIAAGICFALMMWTISATLFVRGG